MDRRFFLALAGGWMAAGVPRQTLAALPAPPIRRLTLHNAHTGESFDGPYRNDAGPIPEAMAELSVFLRDHHSGARIAYDVAVLDFLGAVMARVGATQATVLSAYRTPATNAMLARTTFGVADNSQHLYGRALDIRLDTRLSDAMEAARAMKRGGVGWYPHSGFIHIDSGPVRNWTLDGHGIDHLLSRIQQMLMSNGTLSGPEARKLFAGRPHHPITVRERLAMQRVVAKAEFLSRHH
ncbi:MAG TPA: DUF882 domain-containing protein [Stellaceae bacterium]|jgi:uncharacterized protein YcbK (DUF882 family)|nr:DUF882 domain-containing protein [Stellaceae bacterium]